MNIGTIRSIYNQNRKNKLAKLLANDHEEVLAIARYLKNKVALNDSDALPISDIAALGLIIYTSPARHRVTSDLLDVFESYHEKQHTLIRMLSTKTQLDKELVRFCLEQDTVTTTTASKAIALIIKCCGEFNLALFMLIVKHELQFLLVQQLEGLSNKLADTKIAIFRTSDLLSLVNAGAFEFDVKMDTLVLLAENNALNARMTNQLINSALNAALLQLLKVLNSAGLLRRNTPLVQTLLDHPHQFRIYRVMAYLSECNLLNTAALEKYLNAANNENDARFGAALYEIFTELNSQNIQITQPVFEKIFQLTDYECERLRFIINKFIACKLLDMRALEQALDRLLFHLPTPEEASISVHKFANDTIRESCIAVNAHRFVHASLFRSVASGGFGTIYQGYCSQGTEFPSYSIKQIQSKYNLNDEVKEAKRETAYARLLGRDAFFCRYTPHPKSKTRTYVISDWQAGASLESIPLKIILNIPLVKRIKCLLHLLIELNNLHAKYQLHGDIKPGNVILDLSVPCAKLIDFGSAKRCHSPDSLPATLGYSEIAGFKGDMVALALTCHKLFPDLADKEPRKYQLSIKKIDADCEPGERCVVKLLQRMRGNGIKSCTALDAMQYARHLFRNFTAINAGQIGDIAATTIEHTTTTVEDVLRM